MYEIALLLHSYTRWLVVIVMLWAIVNAWWGLLRQRTWTVWDRRAGAAFAILITVQFVWGVILYLVPNGLAQAALRDMGASMQVRELRFFGLEHPLQMVIALTLVHLGWTRSRKAPADRTKFRWAAGTYTVATLLILSAIPWWRPFARALAPESAAVPLTVTAVAAQDNPSTAGRSLPSLGDTERGKSLFTEATGGLPACATCHSLGNDRLVGPGLHGIALRAAERVDGQPAAVYLYNSIVDPEAYIVEGYANVMPASFDTVLTEAEIQDLVAYLLTMKE